MNNINITIFGLIFTILLSIVYFSRKRVNYIENKIYSALIIISLISTIVEIASFILVVKGLSENSILYTLILKLLFECFLTWLFFFTLYFVVITLKDKEKSSINNLIKKALGILFLVIIISSFLPISINKTNKLMLPIGAGVNIIYVCCGICIITMIYLLIRNIKKLSNKKYWPLPLILFIFSIVVILQKAFPDILLINPALTLLTFIMYFTIENPDVQMIEQLNIAKDQADKANQAKTDFLSSMSHEIRTPLNAIVGFSECMLPSNSLEEIKGFAKDIVDASHNLLEIVNGILDISKIEANKMEIIPKEYNPREVFNSLCKLVKPRIGDKPIEFKANISPDLPGILKGDMSKVKQIILNLLTNAAKYTDKGSIEFNVTCVNRQDTKKCLLYIAVKDTGRGIKKEDISKLFNKFERIDEDRNTTIEGTGLGLAITKNLTEMMGGKITVDSKFESGSVFRVYLEQEIISMEVPENNSEEIEIDYSANPGKRILIVDDSKINLKVANQILKPYNFNVKMVESGYECLEVMESSTFDLILMDIMMPKMNGVETLRRLKEIDGFDIPVVALTADAIEGMDEKYLNAGFDAYLSKPIDRYQLDRVLNKFLGGNEDDK